MNIYIYIYKNDQKFATSKFSSIKYIENSSYAQTSVGATAVPFWETMGRLTGYHIYEELSLSLIHISGIQVLTYAKYVMTHVEYIFDSCEMPATLVNHCKYWGKATIPSGAYHCAA